MARIASVNIPKNKRVVIALTYVFGIGKTSAESICKIANVSLAKRVHELTEDELHAIRTEIDSNYNVEGDLRRAVAMNIKREMDQGTYRGLRHRRRLPVRGQRTHTNARTRKGKAVAIAGKKK